MGCLVVWPTTALPDVVWPAAAERQPRARSARRGCCRPTGAATSGNHGQLGVIGRGYAQHAWIEQSTARVKIDTFARILLHTVVAVLVFYLIKRLRLPGKEFLDVTNIGSHKIMLFDFRKTTTAVPCDSLISLKDKIKTMLS